MNNNKHLNKYIYFLFNIIDYIIHTYYTRLLVCIDCANVHVPDPQSIDADQHKAIDTIQRPCYYAAILDKVNV
jgi:hypothetical protein